MCDSRYRRTENKGRPPNPCPSTRSSTHRAIASGGAGPWSWASRRRTLWSSFWRSACICASRCCSFASCHRRTACGADTPPRCRPNQPSSRPNHQSLKPLVRWGSAALSCIAAAVALVQQAGVHPRIRNRHGSRCTTRQGGVAGLRQHRTREAAQKDRIWTWRNASEVRARSGPTRVGNLCGWARGKRWEEVLASASTLRAAGR